MVRRNAGIVDLSHLGRLTVTGRDRASFLNGLLTNDIASLKENQGLRACLLTPKARILADIHVQNLADRMLLDTGQSPARRVKDTLDQFIISEDVKVEDSTDQALLLSVQGPAAGEKINRVLRIDVSALKPLETTAVGPSLIIRRDRTGQGGYDIIVPRNEVEPVWQAFLLDGVTPVGTEALEILRIEAGQPKYGTDFDETTLVLEAGLKDAISFNKGCYMGQEVVARATFIGRVNRRLVQLRAKSSHSIPMPAKIYGDDNKEAGLVTSLAYSPAMSSVVCFGYVSKDFAKEGVNLEIITGQDEHLSATVSHLS